MDSDNTQYTDLFVSEAQSIEEMSRLLLAIEAGRQNGAPKSESVEQIAGLFRAAHTLKGMAAALGFQQIAGLAHRTEDVLELCRQKQRNLTPPLANVLFACLDRLGRLVNLIASSGSEDGESAHELALLDEVLQAPSETARTQSHPEAGSPSTSGHPAWKVQLQIAPDCQLKGPRAFVVLRRLSTLSPISDYKPPESELLAGNYEDGFSLFFGADASPQALCRAAELVAEVVAAKVKSIAVLEAASPVVIQLPIPVVAAPVQTHPEADAASTVVRLKVSARPTA